MSPLIHIETEFGVQEAYLVLQSEQDVSASQSTLFSPNCWYIHVTASSSRIGYHERQRTLV